MDLSAKRTDVAKLLKVLKTDLEDGHMAAADRLSSLERLKVYGRDVRGAEGIYSAEGIDILARIATTSSDQSVAREALRCLANALFLDERLRQCYIDGGFIEKTCGMYASESVDDEFLLARILFFTTYTAKKESVQEWVDGCKLVEHTSKALHRHALSYLKGSTGEQSQMQEMALVETLKLVFNLQVKLAENMSLFLENVGDLFIILNLRKLQAPPIQSPIKDILNALSNVNISEAISATFPTVSPNKNVARLVEILDKSTAESYLKPSSKDDFDDLGASLIKVLYDVYPCAPEDTKKFLRDQLLPKEEERDKPLGHGSSLSARLLTITTSAMAPNIRSLISALLFQLSNNDPATFVANVGYGFASGYLMSQGMAVPEEAMKSQSSTAGRPVNPITGQRLDTEKFPDLPEMTEEEKEREAEKLFVLFERLKKTGVIDVQNPVRTAVEEGRFEEVE